VCPASFDIDWPNDRMLIASAAFSNLFLAICYPLSTKHFPIVKTVVTWICLLTYRATMKSVARLNIRIALSVSVRRRFLKLTIIVAIKHLLLLIFALHLLAPASELFHKLVRELGRVRSWCCDWKHCNHNTCYSVTVCTRLNMFLVCLVSRSANKFQYTLHSSHKLLLHHRLVRFLCRS
jgi:hypothetical protein